MGGNILEKIRNFSALDERDCQAAWLFAHWDQFGRETRAWPDGADPPHFHMHIGKIGQFFRIRVFPATNVGLCVHGPCKTTGDLQNTPGTPAMHFPLVVAGSQSALYDCVQGAVSTVLCHRCVANRCPGAKLPLHAEDA